MFLPQECNRRFQYVVIGYKDTYFVRDHSDAPQKYSDADVIKMLEYLIDNIFVEFGGRIFQQIIGIPMRTNCAPLLADFLGRAIVILNFVRRFRNFIADTVPC